MPGTEARWRLCTPAERPGAIALIQIVGDAQHTFDTLGMKPIAVGDMRLRDLAGIDHCLVARPSKSLLLLMPHGGIEVVRQCGDAFTRAGLHHDASPSPRDRFPEADSDFEAALLDTLARAVSPLAVDLLLAQPDRWAASGTPAPTLDTPTPAPEDSRLLDRLVTPPLVVAVGPSNIGKSTLLNRLAGRSVAITADEPGTTRDHVGSLVDLDGLIVRYVDTPGVRPDAGASERAASALVAPLLAGADLVLRLGDHEHPAPLAAERSSLAIALRADLGVGAWPHDLAVSARTGEGLPELTTLLRRTLLPDGVLADPTPWRFWASDADRPDTRGETAGVAP